MHVCVLGAGIVGITTAHSLLRRGHAVTVIDRAPEVARGASFGNGGQLSYSYANPMASPDLLKALPGMMSGQDPAFRMSYTPNVAFAKWGVRFLLNCAPRVAAVNTERLTQLALYSRDVLHDLVDEHAIAFDYRRNGKIVLLSTDAEIERATETARRKTELGCPLRVLERETLLDLEPALRDGPQDFVGGVHSEIDEAGNSHALAQGLVEICGRSPDFHLRLATKVKGINRDRGRVSAIETDQGDVRADAYVLSLGSESPLVAKTLGLNIPVYPLKGYSVTVPLADGAPAISITDTRNRMVFCGLGDRLRIAGIAELVGYDDFVDQRRIDQLIGLARIRFPRGGTYHTVLDRWQGWRPMTPSSLPIIGTAPGYENLFVNTGHGMFGWTLACGSADLVARHISGEHIPPPLQPVLSPPSR